MRTLGEFGRLSALALVAFGACSEPGQGGGSEGHAGEGGAPAGGTAADGEPTSGSSPGGVPSGGQPSPGAAGMPEGGDTNQVCGGGESGAEAGAGDAGSSGGAGEGFGGEGGAGPESKVRWLGDCTPRGLSKDGKTVLADEGVWTEDTGWQAIPDLPGGTDDNQPRALSRDGKVVYGLSGSALGEELYRWTAATGIEGLGVTHIPMSTNLDGSVLVGFSDLDGDSPPYRWTMADGFLDLVDSYDATYPTEYFDAIVNEAGDTAYFSAVRETARWTATGGPGGTWEPGWEWQAYGQVTAMSADGSRIAFYNGFGTYDFQATGLCLTYFEAEGRYAPPFNPPESCYGPYFDDVFVVVQDYDGTAAHAVGIDKSGEDDWKFFYWSERGDQRPLEELLPEGIELSPIPNVDQYTSKYPPFPPHPYLSDDAHTLLAQDSRGACFLAEISEPASCYRCPPQDPAPDAIQWIGGCLPTGFSDDGSAAYASRGIWTEGFGWTRVSPPAAGALPAPIDFGDDCLYADAGSDDTTPCGEATFVTTSASTDGTRAVGNEYRSGALYRQFYWSSSGGLVSLDSALVGGTDQLAFPGVYQLEYQEEDGFVRRVFISKDGEKVFSSNQDGICFIGTVKP
jgi:hypothetical protein